ncbi:MAG: hypothetical protein CL844_09665 [Crocinitomicaceae bacterium]|nr:hypothetical protein [Crocinitomicaceae bacterium]
MNPSKLFIRRFVLSSLLVESILFLYFFIDLSGNGLLLNLIINGFIFLFFLIGSIIIAPSIGRKSKSFINRFILSSFIQFIFSLSVLAIVIYNMYNLFQVRFIAVVFILHYLVLLLIQSIFLIRRK